jgi:hypothetical protein
VADKGVLTRSKQWLYCTKSFYISKQTPTPPNKTSITLQSPLQRVNLMNKTNQA